MFKKLLSFAKKVADLPDKPNKQISAAEVKSYFDGPAEEVRQTLNQLIDDLQSSTVGESGAKYIGVTSFDGSPDKLQDALQWLKSQINEMAVGQIPDRSIPEIKLAATVGGTIRGNANQPLVLEVRTSDPQAPLVGQVWLRSDLF
jgi:hypothetical protein